MGKWEKAWIKDRIQYASDKKIDLYESMWEGYIDKTEHMPKSLFKFFPFNHNSLKCIENNSVFMNNPSNFNDPFDCLLCANENEFLKYCLLDYLKETDAVGREILSQAELNKLEYSFCGDWEQHRGSIYNTFPNITGSVPQMIQATMERFRNLIIREKVIKVPNQMEALRIFNYPYQAIEEAVVNAFYHRDYMSFEPVTIEIEPDCINIMNFPGIDRSISEKTIAEGKRFVSRYYRNRRLGEFLKELDLSEGHSSGIPTIQEELEKNGSPRAEFFTDEDRRAMRIRIPIHPAFLEADDEVLLPDSYEKATKKSSKKKIKQYEKILKLLNDGEWHKTAEIADNLGLKDTRTKELLKELIALDKLIDNGKTKGKLYRLK